MTTTQITTYRQQIATGNWTCIDVSALLDEIEALASRVEAADKDYKDMRHFQSRAIAAESKVVELQAITAQKGQPPA